MSSWEAETVNPFHLLCTDESGSRCAGQTPDKGNGLAGADHRPLRSAHPSWLLSVHVFVTAGGTTQYLQLVQAGSGHIHITSTSSGV